MTLKLPLKAQCDHGAPWCNVMHNLKKWESWCGAQ